MPYVPFHNYFPDVAERETRTITVLNSSPWGLPADHYSFLEMFCDESNCDCRRVFFYVVSSLRKDVVAVIAYGWESPEFYAEWMRDDNPETIRELKGPVLNLGSPQSDLARPILRMMEIVLLQDQAYIERVKAHYWMFKHQVDSKSKQRGSKKKRKE